MSKIFVGIDPGKKGGIAGIDEEQKIIFAITMPLLNDEYDKRKINQLFVDLKSKYELFVVLEKCHTMPLNGAKPNFTNGFQYGIMQTVLEINNISFEIVLASHWQKVVFQGMTVTDTKIASINFCLRKFPDVNLKVTDRCKNNSDGISDGLCIAVYSYRINAINLEQNNKI